MISFKSCFPKITNYRNSHPYYSSTTQAWQREFVSSSRARRGYPCNCISGTNGSSCSWNSRSGIIRQKLLFASTSGNSFFVFVWIRTTIHHISQPFDLTDMDWSAELWVACHDDDEQNARLAHHLWEDNGLDVPETFLDDLLPFLGLQSPHESVVTFTNMSPTYRS